MSIVFLLSVELEVSAARYPISHSTRGMKVEDFFYSIVTFHTPFGEDVCILDPTCGKRYLWKKFLRKTFLRRPIDGYGRVIFSDIQDYGQEIVCDIAALKLEQKVDLIVYDPPYFVEVENSLDPRCGDYGGYTHTYGELLWFMEIANDRFPGWLKPGGKVIVRCADQYIPKYRRFFGHHITWITQLSRLDLIDLFVFLTPRVSPLAFLVKDRPCSVIQHSYFLVFQKKNGEGK